MENPIVLAFCRPHRCLCKTPECTGENILEWKAAQPSRDAPRIAGQIAHDGGIRIASVTVWRILKRAGMKTSRKRKKHSGVLERVHRGCRMEGETPLKRFSEVYGCPDVVEFPVVLLDDLATTFVLTFLP